MSGSFCEDVAFLAVSLLKLHLELSSPIPPTTTIHLGRLVSMSAIVGKETRSQLLVSFLRALIVKQTTSRDGVAGAKQVRCVNGQLRANLA